MYLLAVDTSLSAASVAIIAGDLEVLQAALASEIDKQTGDFNENLAPLALPKIVVSLSVDLDKTHSETILELVDSCLKIANLQLKDIAYFAAVTGPGSFTGIRIGVTLVKTLAYTQNKPCLAISSLAVCMNNFLALKDSVRLLNPAVLETALTANLEAAAILEKLEAVSNLDQAKKPGCSEQAEMVNEETRVSNSVSNQAMLTLYCPLIDARNDRYFCLLTSESNLYLAPQALALSELISAYAKWQNKQPSRLIFLNTSKQNLALKYRELIANLPISFIEETVSASSAAKLAFNYLAAFGEKVCLRATNLEPNYLALSQAERMRVQALDPELIPNLIKWQTQTSLAVNDASNLASLAPTKAPSAISSSTSEPTLGIAPKEQVK